jgi:hypothetical protein
MKFLFIGIFNFLFFAYGFSQIQYEEAFSKLLNNLRSNTPNFKDAVFLTETTYDNKLSPSKIQKEIEFWVDMAKMRLKSDSLIYTKSDVQKIRTYAAIFKVLTDTTLVILPNEKNNYKVLPFVYDFDDIFGEKKWENMFVSKLLERGKGNCHSMPYLYKILCEELGVPCWLALAPNHIYVKHRSEKAGMYNTELTSASFPIDAWLMASGYITLEAIQNGIYMDALNDKQCIALCVLDLAKGYEKKYPDNDGTFILKCCDLTMEYIPNCINALLLKAETKKKQIEKLVIQRGITYAVFKMQADGKIMWEEMRSTYEKIHKLGYRTMPEKMYVDWLVSLKAEREKYSNKQVTEMNKD